MVLLLQMKTKKERDMSNKNMNPIFSLKNFRSFGEAGADFELAPITVLTGCNSAGKSSLVKALMLLSQATETTMNEFDGPFSTIIKNVSGVDLLVSAKDLCLGNYTRILNKKSKDDLIELSYDVWSNLLRDKISVVRLYKEDQKDLLHNGQLIGLSIKKSDGTLIYGKGLGIKNTYKQQLLQEDECFNRDCLQDAINHLDILSEYYSKRKEYDEAKNKWELFQQRQEEYKDWEDYEDFQHRIHKDYDKAMSDFGKAKKRVEESDITKEVFDKFEEDCRIEIEECVTLKRMDIYRKWSSDELRKICGGDDGIESHGYNYNDKTFLNMLAEEVLNPPLIKDIKYVSSSSAMISRLYTVDDKDKLNIALKLFLQRKKSYKNGRPDIPGVNWFFPGQFINRWIKKLEIGEKIHIVGTDEGLGVKIYLEKEKGQEKEQWGLLADEGYGITQLFTLLLHIDNMMLEHDKPYFICVEEPEIHLHPKYQSLLADMFVDAYQKYNIHFIIETHSEYLIRKLQVLVAEKKLEAEDVSLNYVEKNEEGVSHNRQIKIEEDGDLSESFGTGFYDEADKLAIKLFQNKPILS